MKIPFNVPYVVGSEIDAIIDSINSRRLCGGGGFGTRCEQQLQSLLLERPVLLTTSCTDALEMCAALIDVQPGDEILAPSFTFVSSVNPFVIRGARIKFLDIDYPSLNVSAASIEAAITPTTKAVIAVHYGGGSGEIRAIREICDQYEIILIEDAAQSLMATYDNQPLGTFGHLACLSFHETKNIQCGEGGALVINDPVYFERAEIIREKGTNRSKFFRGQVDKYSWIDIGSSHIPSELNSAFLSKQLESAQLITQKRLAIWGEYKRIFDGAGIDYVRFADNVRHNAHLFGLLTSTPGERPQIMGLLKELGIQTTFHYVPLHSSTMGRQFGQLHGVDKNTTNLGDRLIRLPLYPDLSDSNVGEIAEAVVQIMSS